MARTPARCVALVVAADDFEFANRQASADYADKRRTVASAYVAYVVYAPILLLIGGALVWISTG